MFKQYTISVFIFLTCIFSCSTALARLEFEVQDFNAADLGKVDSLREDCQSELEASFWCDHLDARLYLITTKGKDIFFNEAGEIVALFSKNQRGQDMNGRYNLDNGQNLIPSKAVSPGGALLLEGEYFQPENAQAAWRQIDDITWRGSFEFDLPRLHVVKTIDVKATDNTLQIDISPRALEPVSTYSDSINTTASETAITDEASPEPIALERLYLSFPGIAKNQSPIIKIGQSDSASENPLQGTEASLPSYISFQTAATRGSALIMQPQSSGLLAVSLPQSRIALIAEPQEEFRASVYGGPNELIRYYQEGYYQLPELFRPNLFGRVSLGVVNILETIHGYVNNWGLSIILITLLFRLLIWPLMTAQTKNMKGMQTLQPKMQALQKKHKDNREKLNQEMMKLYQEAGVNPAMGCMPMLLQMPLFFIFWRVFMNFEFNEGFLWVADLGLKDGTYILPILYIAVMVASSLMMTTGNRQTMQQMVIMNVVFAFIMVNFPAGVLLYWVVSMGVQVGQQWLIQRSA